MARAIVDCIYHCLESTLDVDRHKEDAAECLRDRLKEING